MSDDIPAPPSRTAATPEIRPLLAEHADLAAAFLDHQARLVEGDPAGAEEALHACRGRVSGHLLAEERLVLPLYEARVARPPKGARVDYFRREHVKIERHLAEAAAWMTAWRGRAWPAREIVLFVEREKVYKEIMEHHDEREDHFLYPCIEEVTDAGERRGLVASFRDAAATVERAWAAAPLGHCPTGGGTAAGRGPDLRGTGREVPLPAQVAAWCIGRLEERVAALAEGRENPRGPASWEEGRLRLRQIRRELSAPHDPRRTAALVDATQILMTDVTPIRRFPVARAAEVQSSWHVLMACGRAARSPA